jgi:transcriptional regulator with XRE-family HTH domain
LRFADARELAMDPVRHRPSEPTFGQLLRAWRATRRLSQLELALASRVSQRHLSFLESGRAQPSRPMVFQLATTLDLPLRECNVLLTAAGFAPHYRESRLGSEQMAPIAAALKRSLAHHEPYPAVVVDRDYDIVLENRAFATLIALLGPRERWVASCCPRGVPNLLYLTLHAHGARPYIRNLDEIGPLLVQRAYRDYALRRGTATGAFLEALRAAVDIPATWPTAEVPSSPVLPLILAKDGIELELFSLIATFGTPADLTTDELRIETFYPANPATEQVLHAMSAGVAVE